MREYTFKVNGFEVKATYRKEEIEDVFKPIVKELSLLQKEKQKRIVVFLAAPPAVGKSTLCELFELLSKEEGNTEIQSLGMDGFHYTNAYLNTHTTVIEGETKLLKEIKGSPLTYDVNGLYNTIEMLKTDNIRWPIYDRNLHDVVENQILITKDIILIEGNYLLLDDEVWKPLQELCDYSIFVKANSNLLKERLINRKVKGGTSIQDATAFYEKSDSKNVSLVLNRSLTSNIILNLDESKGYKMR